MLKGLGRLIWTQSREIRVCNYPKHFVYEIYTNQGFQNIVIDKDTKAVQIIDGLSYGIESSSFSNVSKNQDQKTLLPTLK